MSARIEKVTTYSWWCGECSEGEVGFSYHEAQEMADLHDRTVHIP